MKCFGMLIRSMHLSKTWRYSAHYFDPQLPLIDLGCGNGTQTRFLADHFTKRDWHRDCARSSRIGRGDQWRSQYQRIAFLMCCTLMTRNASTTKSAMPIST